MARAKWASDSSGGRESASWPGASHLRHAGNLASCVSAGRRTAADRPCYFAVEPVSGIEPLTCRLQEGLSSASNSRFSDVRLPCHLHRGLSGACWTILTTMPPYTGECHSVRVIRVLDAFSTWTCVGFVLLRSACGFNPLTTRTALAVPDACAPIPQPHSATTRTRHAGERQLAAVAASSWKAA